MIDTVAGKTLPWGRSPLWRPYDFIELGGFFQMEFVSGTTSGGFLEIASAPSALPNDAMAEVIENTGAGLGS